METLEIAVEAGPNRILYLAKQSSLKSAQKMKSSTKDFFSKCDQISWQLPIRSNLLMKSLMENFIFGAVKFGTN